MLRFGFSLLLLLVTQRWVEGHPASSSGERTLCAGEESTDDIDVSAHAHSQSFTPCQNRFAGEYPCSNVDLMAFLDVETLGDVEVNDVWGWVDEDGTEYVLAGSRSATHIIDISNPIAPVYLANLTTHSFPSRWHDIKTYRDHAFIVADLAGLHGMQVLDLKQLGKIDRTRTDLPVVLEETAHYDGIGSAHNVAINEDTGYAYVVGDRRSCAGGLHMVDISNPIRPEFAGCYREDGYTHDVQCVIYRGNHQEYVGREICFASNEDTLTIVDVSDKTNPVQLARFGNEESRLFQYSHQGWLTEDHGMFFLDDELDEVRQGINTRTFALNVQNLTAPFIDFVYTNRLSNSSDHNQFVIGNILYQANYRSGIRIIDISLRAFGFLTEIGFFDTTPSNDRPGFRGTWGVFPYFPSGIIAATSMQEGVFILKYNRNGVVLPGYTRAPTTSYPTHTPTDSLPPSMSPAPSVSPSPTTEPTLGPLPPRFCFSGVTQVQEQQRGLIPMEQLRIGDYVLTKDQQFERVYGFGHYHKTVEATFLQIHVVNGERPLEITDNHMVFVSLDRAVPAGLLKKGDRIVTDKNGGYGIVERIGSVRRSGVYGPFTASGTLFVDGVLVSNYVSLHPSDRLLGGLVSYQWLCHAFEAPHRMICRISNRYCENEKYNDIGISKWLEGPMETYYWLEEFAPLGSVLLFVFLPLFGLASLVDWLSSQTAWVVIATVLAVLLSGSMGMTKKYA